LRAGAIGLQKHEGGHEQQDHQERPADLSVGDEAELEEVGHDVLLAVAVGRVALVEGEVVHRGDVRDALGVGEGEEAVLAVVPPVPAGAHSAERQVQVGHLQHGVVDHVRAGGGVAAHQLGVGRRLAELVDHQGLRPRVDFGDERSEVGVVEEREDGSEDLVLHEQGSLAGRFDDSWADEAGVLVDGLAAVDDAAAVVVLEVFLDAVDVEATDDLAVVAVLLQVLLAPVEQLQLLQKGLAEGLADGLVDEDVVDANAGLPAVEELAEQDAVGGSRDVGSLVHDHWALAAQLQDAGHEVLGGLDGHQPTSHRRPSEANDVHRQLRHCLCHLHFPFNHAEESFILKALLGSR
jgi:hypothetical protein